MRLTATFALVLWILRGLALHGHATPHKPASDPAVIAETHLAVTSVNLTQGKLLVGMEPAEIQGSPIHCSSEGDAYLEVYPGTDPVTMNSVPHLYRVSNLGDAKRLERMTPSGYGSVSSKDLYGGKQEVVTLLEATGKKDAQTSAEREARHFFLSITDPNGLTPRLTELALKFEPYKIAALDSGHLIVLGIDHGNEVPVLALLDGDGSFLRIFDINPVPYESADGFADAFRSKSSGSAAFRDSVDGSVSRALFVPHGSKVLFVQPGSSLPIRLLDDAGESSVIKVPMPKGFLLESVLAGGANDAYVVRVQEAGAFQKFASGKVIENPQQKLLEADPLHGKLLRELVVRGPAPGEVNCAVDHTLSATFYEADDSAKPANPANPANPGTDHAEGLKTPDRFVFSSAPR